MKKPVEVVKNKVYVNVELLTDEEQKAISQYLYDLELDEECLVKQFGDYIVAIVSRYSQLTAKDIEIEIRKILGIP